MKMQLSLWIDFGTYVIYTLWFLNKKTILSEERGHFDRGVEVGMKGEGSGGRGEGTGKRGRGWRLGTRCPPPQLKC